MNFRKGRRVRKHDDIEEAGLLFQFDEGLEAWLMYGDVGRGHRLLAIVIADEQIEMRTNYETGGMRRVHQTKTRIIFRAPTHPVAHVVNDYAFNDYSGLRTTLRKLAKAWAERPSRFERLAEERLLVKAQRAGASELEIMDARWGDDAVRSLARLAREHGAALEMEDALAEAGVKVEEADHE